MPPSTSLTTFANDGITAWARTGSRLIAIDPRSGQALRSVRLDPAPFGLGWRVERQGSFFVVRDDHEIAAYDEATGTRVWKRTWPTNVFFVAEREGRHVSIVPGGDGAWVDVALADLRTGAFETRVRVEGTMRFVGAHGTVAGDLLFFATDERDVFAVDLARWQVTQHHHLEGARVLPPVATSCGVHVAAVSGTSTRAVTRLLTLDRTTGAILASHELPGAACSFSAGPSGLVLEGRSSPGSPIERVSFRPETPHLRLIVAKDVDLRLVRTDAPSFDARRLSPAQVVVADAPVPGRRSGEGNRDELVPAPRDGSEGRTSTPGEGLLGLLALLEADSAVLRQLAGAFDSGSASRLRLSMLGITLRDPRVRWSSGAGRDPGLIALAENREGDAISTYFYPPSRRGKVPVVLVARATGEARWVAEDLDVWFAGMLHDALAYAPDAVHATLDALGLPASFPRPLPAPLPPPWFFEAHATTWTLADAETALADGDVEGAERMLVAVGRVARSIGLAGAEVKMRLASVYTTLGWDHHRATVVETW